MGHQYSVRAGRSLTSPKPIIKDTDVPKNPVIDRTFTSVNPAPPENGEDEVGWLGELIDNIGRFGNSIRSGLDPIFNESNPDTILEGMRKGWFNEIHTTGNTSLTKAVDEAHKSGGYDKLSDTQKMAVDFVGSNFFKATAGLVYDVATDPLSYPVVTKAITTPLGAVVKPAAKAAHHALWGTKAEAKHAKRLTEEQAAAKGLETERVRVGEEVGPKEQPTYTPAGSVQGNDIGGAVFPEPQLGPGRTPTPGPPRSESGAIITEPPGGVRGGPHAPSFDPTTRSAGAQYIDESGRPVFAPEYNGPGDFRPTSDVSGLTEARNLSNAQAARMGRPVPPPGPTDFFPSTKTGTAAPFPDMLNPKIKGAARAKLQNPIEPKPLSPATEANVARAAAHDVEQAEKLVDDIIPKPVTEADIAANRTVAEVGGDIRATDSGKTNVGIPDGPYPTEAWNTVVNNNAMATRTAGYVRAAKATVKAAPDATHFEVNSAMREAIATGDRPAYNAIFEEATKTHLKKTLASDKHAMLQSGTAPVIPYKAAGEKIPKKYFLHMADIMHILPDTVYRSFFKIKGQTPPSSWMGAAAAAIHHSNLGKTGPELTELVKKAFLDYNKTKQVRSGTMAEQAAKAITKPENLAKLKARLLENETFIAKADHKVGAAVGESTAAKVIAVLDDPGSSMADELNAVADIHGSISRELNAAGGLPGEASAATQTAGKALERYVDDLDVAAARTTLRGVKASQRGDEVAVRRILLEQYKRDAKASKEISARDAGEYASNAARNIEPKSTYAPPSNIIADIADQETENFLNFFQRVYRGTAIKLFGGAGQGKFFGIRRQSAQTFGKMHTAYNRELSVLEKDYGREAVDNMFSQIRLGKSRNSMSQGDKLIYDDMYSKMKNVFDPAGGFLENAVLRSGQTVKGFNAQMKRRGLPQYELTEAFPGEPLAQAYQRSVKDWKIEDPLDFLSKMNQVSMDSATLSAMARAAEAKGSLHYQEGYSRIARSKEFDDAPVSHYVDNEMWIPDTIIEELRMANSEMLRTIHWGKSTTPAAKFMNEVFDPMTRAWKTFATSLRPGHHAANASGDAIANFVHGVNGTDYLRANRALRSVGMVEPMPYAIMEEIALGRQINNTWRATKGSTGKHRQRVADRASEHNLTMNLKGGKQISYTNGQFGDNLFRNGALSEFRQLEDIEVAAKIGEVRRFNKSDDGLIDRGLNRVLNTRYGRVMEKSGEWNANMQRSAQIAKHLRDPKFTKKFETEEDAWFAAVESSFKTHPDAGGLTAFEKKWGRRVMPFYSYTRQILPWVMINFMKHPGRMLAIPKAQYSMQVLMGQDPKQIGAPFTEMDSLPPWAKSIMAGNVLGEDGDPTNQNLGFSLSSPLDTLAEFTNNPEEGLVGSAAKATTGMLNPLITGIPRMMDPVNDTSEELDQSLPGLSTVSSITGRSPTGTLGNIISARPELDPTRQYEQGRKTQFLNESLVNFFLGLRVSDYSEYSAPAPRMGNRL